MENGIYEKKDTLREYGKTLDNDNNNNNEYMHARTLILKQYVIHAMIPSPGWCVSVFPDFATR